MPYELSKKITLLKFRDTVAKLSTICLIYIKLNYK